MIKNLYRKIVKHRYTCPSCGFVVFEEPAGSYDICKICGWEDDHVQLQYPGLEGGANTISLKQSQDKILEKIPFNVKKYKSYTRDKKWRPLLPDEAIIEDKGEGENYFKAAVKTSPQYYWLNR